MSAGSSTRMLLQIAMRSLFAHKVKSLIVGIILTFGVFLMAGLMTLFSNIHTAMEQSITGSLIGHLQVISDKAKDDLAFFGPAASTAQDLGELESWTKARDALKTVPNVKGVVPMGRDFAQVMGGNLLDDKLDEMRAAVKAGDAEKIRKLGIRIRQVATLLKEENENRLKLSAKKDEINQNLVVLNTALSDSFWKDLNANPTGCRIQLPGDKDSSGCLDFLETKLAPLQSDAATLFLAYLGTDLDLFRQTFDKFRIVEGQMVPKGERGMLLSTMFYEQQAKNPIARMFDEINDGIHKDGKRITDGKTRWDKADPKLHEEANRLGRQTRRLLFELGPDESAAVEKELTATYGPPRCDQASVEKKCDPNDTLKLLLDQLLTVNQDSFDEHFKTFYDVVAPKIQLYQFRPGDTVTLRAFTRSGYSRSANIKVWGTFKFEKLDGSLVSSVYNLIDLMTFRDLYGLMTPERKKELDEIRKEVGAKEVNAATSEADLFGDSSTVGAVATAQQGDISNPTFDLPGDSHHKKATGTSFTQADIDNGVVINAAVLLKDGSKLKETQGAIASMSDQKKLGLKSVTWEQAAGIIGQMIWVFQAVLGLFFVIAFIVILAVINNAMLMATKDRVVEIGTMRAIGAQRNFVLSMILLETIVLWLVSAAIGLIGAGVLYGWLGSHGIPAGTEPIMIVFFGGPRLYPHLTMASVAFSLICIGVVSFAATIYPAWSATRVPPIVAMQRRE